ncbi:ankyrin repeat domain-containing protein [Candidatus Cardinium hertigii]|nr:ankyrin repeat domain-containing protein [Candidatus Cardinium hertigii]
MKVIKIPRRIIQHIHIRFLILGVIWAVAACSSIKQHVQESRPQRRELPRELQREIAQFLPHRGLHAYQSVYPLGYYESELHRCNSLHMAAENGHAICICKLLDDGANVDVPDVNNGFTPLCIAARHGHAACVSLLLAAGANADLPNVNNGFTPLYIAARHGHAECMNLLLTAGADINIMPNGSIRSIIYVAAKNGYAACITTLLDALRRAGASQGNIRDQVNTNCPGKRTMPLHIVAQNGYAACIDALIDAGAMCNKQNTYGDTPLHAAAKSNQANIIRTLVVQHDAILDIKNKYDQTPLHVAIRNYKLDAIKTLLQLGADIHLKGTVHIKGKKWEGDAFQIAALHKIRTQRIECATLLQAYASKHAELVGSLQDCIKNGDISFIEKLQRTGVTLEMPNSNGDTALHLAAQYGQVDVIEALYRHNTNIDMNIRNLYNSRTPLHVAAQYGQPDAIRILLQYGAERDIQDNYAGFTPLHLAALRGQVAAIQALVEAEAPVNVQSNQGLTPLELAIKGKYLACAKILLEAGAYINMQCNNPYMQYNNPFPDTIEDRNVYIACVLAWLKETIP